MRHWNAALIGAVIAAALARCATWERTGRIVDRPCLHVGVRPATDLEGVAVTVRVTTDWPLACVRDAGAP